MSPITTHVLDTARGRPAAQVGVALALLEGGTFSPLASGETNADGRLPGLLPDGHALRAGVYRLTFATGAYFERLGVAGFYPEVAIVFEVRTPGEHYHVPLLLNPFGYSTYRGS